MGKVQGKGRDYSLPISFDLTTTRPNKTIDIGNNGVSASTDYFGRVLQLSVYHPIHGIIVAAPYAQFDKSRYHDSQYVREYRTKMLHMLANGHPGFGITVQDLNPTIDIQHRSMDAVMATFMTTNGISVSCLLHIHDDGTLTQNIVLENTTALSLPVEYLLDLRLSVHRASYGQLTEGGPLLPPDCDNRLRMHEGEELFAVSNPALGGRLRGGLTVDGKPEKLTGIHDMDQKGDVLGDAVTPVNKLTLEPGSRVKLAAWFALSPSLESNGVCNLTHPSSAPPFCESATTKHSQQWRASESCRTYIVRRNVDYILGNCTIPISDDVIGLITDHVALPLGWNRDNYWQWRLLLKVRQNRDRLLEPNVQELYETKIDRVLKGHLKWVYQTAERPHKFWHRSYVITGKPKDGPTFQLDQQCYPLLELCDYYEAFPDEKQFVSSLVHGSAMRQVLELILSKRHPSTGLFPTDETPGDDAVAHPFHFSSHVLLWYTLSRLAEFFQVVGTAPAGFSYDETAAIATQIRRTSLEHFIQRSDDGDHPSRIAYLVDGVGAKTFYHDANDIPTIFAAEWGFLTSEPELAAWRNTVKFAFSDENQLGYASDGLFAGLGSVHSKGAWPLGYFQELLYAHISGDELSKTEAIKRVVGSMQWDGTFGEAVDVKTGAVTSKAWFSWPGAMIAAMIIDTNLEF